MEYQPLNIINNQRHKELENLKGDLTQLQDLIQYPIIGFINSFEP